MLSASFDSDRDELVVYRGKKVDSTPEKATTIVPWILFDPISVKLDKPPPALVLDIGRTQEGEPIGAIRPGRVPSFKVPELPENEAYSPTRTEMQHKRNKGDIPFHPRQPSETQHQPLQPSWQSDALASSHLSPAPSNPPKSEGGD